MAELTTLDLVGTITAALLTVMVLSYLLGDNLFFRLAVYLFIGVAAGYAGSIAWYNVIWPGLIDPLVSQGLAGIIQPSNIVTIIVPWLLIFLLLLKVSPATSRYGGLPLALLVGVGAAVVVGGAITGTLIPQSLAAMGTLTPSTLLPQAGEEVIVWFERIISAIILLLATVTTLMYFRFTARRSATGEVRRSKLERIAAVIGQVFIAITFGVMYAGALAATVVILVERIQFLRDVISSLLAG
ncbi:MAG: hypothetical protein E3J37_04290 [Anaerolineales bacterium]|nr:MAG: hypothetical protein E3J37_04290 [Anaerolineales bacterium]